MNEIRSQYEELFSSFDQTWDIMDELSDAMIMGVIMQKNLIRSKISERKKCNIASSSETSTLPSPSTHTQTDSTRQRCSPVSVEKTTPVALTSTSAPSFENSLFSTLQPKNSDIPPPEKRKKDTLALSSQPNLSPVLEESAFAPSSRPNVLPVPEESACALFSRSYLSPVPEENASSVPSTSLSIKNSEYLSSSVLKLENIGEVPPPTKRRRPKKTATTIPVSLSEAQIVEPSSSLVLQSGNFDEAPVKKKRGRPKKTVAQELV